MFDPTTAPRLFGLPPGCDFPQSVVSHILDLSPSGDPTALARVSILVNTTRMQRRMTELFAASGARLLPRIRLIADLASDPAAGVVPPANPPLRRRLQLAQLVRGLLEQFPDLASHAAVFDLADSLAALIDEMQGEGVPFERLAGLDVANHSEHWARSLSFLEIVTGFVDRHENEPLDPEARQRVALGAICDHWRAAPPTDPVIIAGSTGSRGTTALLMQAAARLPQGAVILPGFDFDMPRATWDTLTDPAPAEDHPQYRFAALARALDMHPCDVEHWGGDTPASAPAPARNRLVSLALRPAPVTDEWLSLGPGLGPLDKPTANMTLIEAASARDEALAIALRLRQAVHEGTRAALITPDRMLTRRVTAALDSWGIRPDDSAGTPLHLSAPGRFLRHVAELFGQRLTSDKLLGLLKHPLTHTGGQDRGDHLRLTRDLELQIRRRGPVFPDAPALQAWAQADDSGTRNGWVNWVCTCIDGLEDDSPRPLAAHLDRLDHLCGLLAGGADGPAGGALWDENAGRSALAVIQNLRDEAAHGGTLSPAEFSDLLRTLLTAQEVRSSVTGHPLVAIWGTLEARVQGAELVILGGLNDGIWPNLPSPDPWLNRKMRADCGLLLPERRVGLGAHDFQQAIAAPHVVLSRATRDSDAQTVPSRWLNRLLNLLSGLDEQGGPAARDAMKARGDALLDMSRKLDDPFGEDVQKPATRPSPCPPLHHRPSNISVTQVEKLVRDPFAVYAQSVLKLRPLDPLHPDPDSRVRGVVFHDVMEAFIQRTRDGMPKDARALLMDIAQQQLDQKAPWPSVRRLWLAQLNRIADWFIDTEHSRRSEGTPVVIEDKQTLDIPALSTSLTGKVDRIDRLQNGQVVIYDYKTAKPPTENTIRYFDRQLLLEAEMVQRGAFPSIGPADVAHVAHISLNAKPEISVTIPKGVLSNTWEEFQRLIAAYRDPARGYTSRRAPRTMMGDKPHDYDQLARFGEWDQSQSPTPREVGE